MDYKSELSALHDCLEKWDLSPCEISLWHALWDVAMICGSTGSLSVAASTLAFRTGFQKKSIERARKKLSDFGIIRYRSRGGNKSAVYDLISLVRHTDAQSDPHDIPQHGAQTIPQSDPHTDPIYTTTMVNGSSYIKRHTDAQSDPHTTPQPFMTDAEAFELQAAMDDVLTAAEDIGIPQNASDLNKANALIAEYSALWVREAIKRAGDGPVKARSWRYVEGILRKWRERGGMDEAGAALSSGRGPLEEQEDRERAQREQERTFALLRGDLHD